uniref:Uncharacterized protein n=1 Tax=Plectus sambesii TaxID=2011161 RepID=A0A914XSZ1_9BILA
GVRTRDAGTTPIKSMSMSSSLASIGTSESAPSTAAINNVGVKVSMKDGDTQTDTDSDVPQEPRVLNDSEIADSLWLMPERQVSTAEVAVGDDTVDFVECERCVHSQQTFTRNVGVGVCAVGDRVCINCDRQSSVSSEAENVDENEPPGFCSDDIRRKSTEKPVSLRRMSEGSASPACSDASIADERPRSNSEVVESFTSSAAESQEEEVKPARPKKIDMSKPKVTRAFELSRAAAAKKLLTSEKQDSPPPQFKRNTGISKSMRVEGKKGDHLAYITDQKKHKAPSPVKESPPSSPQKDAKDASQALKGKVSLKKEPPPSKVPQPVPAKIPRPKITKYGQSEQPAQTPDEEDEAVDRLTPLRSEMRALRSWPGSPKTERQRVGVQSVGGAYSNPVALDDDEDEIDSAKPADGRLVGQVVENLPGGDNGGCSSSDSEDSMSEGSYDTSDNVITGKCDDPTATQPLAFELTAPLKEACDVLNKHLLDVNADISNDKQEWAVKYLQHEWLKAAARRNASAVFVEMFLDTLEGFSKELLVKVVNLCDQNENTALHYAVSHGNFDVVSQLLDSKVCNLNRANKAGYTPVMLAALCPIRNDTEMMVVQRLFQMGDVNVKATQHGQTALMLAASHGKAETAKLLVEAGAGVNIQDEDGSTALMCAAEHGHKDVVKLLLASPEVDASLTDYVRFAAFISPETRYNN